MNRNYSKKLVKRAEKLQIHFTMSIAAQIAVRYFIEKYWLNLQTHTPILRGAMELKKYLMKSTMKRAINTILELTKILCFHG